MLSDLLRAFRSLRRSPLFALAIVLILALGVGATTAVFSIVDAVLLRSSPFQATDRLVRVEEGTANRSPGNISARDYLRWYQRTDIFEKIVPYLRDTVTLTGDGQPEQVIGIRSVGLFPLLGVQASLGRPLIASDDAAGSQNVAVLSDRLWKRRYHSDPNVIGRAITISDESYTIVGVMPADFEFRFPEAELWIPFRLTPSNPWFPVAARLREDVSIAQARSAMEVVARQIEHENPKDRSGLRIVLTPWTDLPDEKYRLTLLFVLVAVGLVMLIACADVGGLLLSRAVQRQKEIAIRVSLGAGAWRIVRQLLSESFVLAVLGSLAGLVAARSLLAILTKQLAALPIVLPHLQRVELNGRVLVFSIILCFLLAALCSLAPILLAARTDLQFAFRAGQAATASRGSSRLFSTLIALQAGFAFLLLVGSGLMIRSLIRLQSEDRGLRPDHVLTLRVPVGTFLQRRPTGKYDTRERQMEYYRQILEKVRTVPGIKAAGIVNNLPLSGLNTSLNFRFALAGESQLISARTISSQYFAAMGIPLIAGRDFNGDDRTGSPGVAIINEYLARQLFPDRNPIGEKLPGESKEAGPTVVGVVKDTPQGSYELPANAEVYIPYQQFIFATFMSTVVVRTEGEPSALAATLRQQIWTIDPNQPVVKVETLQEVIDNSIWRPRFSAWIFSVLGGLCVLLTAIGVYGVVAYTSTLRAREMGIRMAMGATPKAVIAATLRSALVPLTTGICVSIVAALMLSRLLTNLLYGISNTDLATYVAAGALLLTIGIVASTRPAWRAAMRDPLLTLRAE